MLDFVRFALCKLGIHRYRTPKDWITWKMCTRKGCQTVLTSHGYTIKASYPYPESD